MPSPRTSSRQYGRIRPRGHVRRETIMATHLVLGATGAIGFWCARLLLNRGERVVALVRDVERARSRFPNDDPSVLTLIHGDAADGGIVTEAASGSDSIIHAVNVPLTLWEDPSRGVAVLLSHTIEAAAKHSCRIIFPANVWVYGHTHVPFLFDGHPFAADTRKGRAAVRLESMLADARREQGVAYSGVRLPDVYGPAVDRGLYRSVFEHALDGKTLVWFGSLDAPLELVYAEDAAAALLQVGLDDTATGRILNLPGAEETTARKWLQLVSEQAGRPVRAQTVPAPVVAVAGWFSNEAHERHELLYLKTRRLILTGDRYCELYGSYPATPYAEGIRRALEWYRVGCPPIGPEWQPPGEASASPETG